MIRFKDASKLVAFAGIDPTIKQSDEFLVLKTKCLSEVLLTFEELSG